MRVCRLPDGGRTAPPSSCWRNWYGSGMNYKVTSHGARLEAMTQLLLKRASTNGLSGEWNADDFDVLADGAVAGRIMKVHATPVVSPWMWTLVFGQREDRTPTHGHEPTREAAMAAFAKSWRRE